MSTGELSFEVLATCSVLSFTLSCVNSPSIMTYCLRMFGRSTWF